MLEIRNKKMVTTRKVHICFGCLEEIEKGKSAVYVSAKEDEQHIPFHLHEECNCKRSMVCRKRSLSWLYKGSTKDLGTIKVN